MTAPNPAGRRPGRPLKHEVAPTEFGRWLDRSDMSIEQFARTAKISLRSAYRLRSGGIPTLDVADRILQIAGGSLNLRSFRAE